MKVLQKVEIQIILNFFLIFSVIGQDINPAAQLHYTRGSTSYEVKDYENAIKEFKEAVEIAPEFTQALTSLAYSYIAIQEYDLAEQELLKVVEIEDSSHLQLFELSKLAENQDDYVTAIDFSSRAIEIEKDIKYFYQRGIQYFKLKDYDEAILDFTEVISLNPNFKDAYNDRGSAYKMNEMYDEAIEDYIQAGDLGRNSGLAYNNLGNTYRKVRDLDNAIEAYNKAIAVNDEDFISINNRGLAKYYNGDLEEAIADFIEVIEMNPDYAMAYSNIAGVYIKMEDYEKAIKYSTQAISINENLASGYYNRAIANELLRNDEKACQDWDKAAEFGVRAAVGHSLNMNCEK